MSSDEQDPLPAQTKGTLGGRLAGLSLPRQIITIALWPFIEQVIAFLVSATDLFIASRLGEHQVDTIAITDGMGAVAYIVWMGFVLQGAVSMGASAVVSHLTGARRFRRANHAAGQSLILGTLIGMVSCGLMLGTLSFLLNTVLKLTPEASAYAAQYMKVAAISAIFSGGVFALNGALRGSGDTRTPFIIMSIVSVMNVILSCLFVWGPGSLGGHGLAGVAGGTVGGFFVGLVVLLILLERQRIRLFGLKPITPYAIHELIKEKPAHYNPPLYLNIRDLKPDWTMQWRIGRIGGPQAIEISIIWMIQFYSIRVISSLADVGSLGAHMIVIRVESMSFLPGFAMGTAASTLVGQYLGANNPLAARNIVRKSAKYAMLFMGTFGLFFLLFPKVFVSIFASKSPDLINLAAAPLQAAGIAQTAFAAGIVLKMSLRTAGDVRRVMVYSILGISFWRIGVLSAWVEFYPETLTIFTIWVIFTVDMITQALIFWKIFQGDKWTTYRV